MPKTLYLVGLTFLACSATARAQRPNPQAVPSPVVEPTLAPVPVEIHPDRTVTFRVWAPRATAVGVSGDFAPPPAPDWYLMAKDPQGIWSITLGPLAPNVWTYEFLVDGVALVGKLFTVPAGTPQFYEPRRVPHGTVHRTSYESRTLGAEMNVSVYTPPGYETSTARYPVLYLLRPAGHSGVTYWTHYGLLNVILDNLIADQKVRPMVVVMPLGYPQPSDRDDFAEQSEYVDNLDRFAEDLFNDLIPFVERTYRAATDADGRAIAGASMGGGQALSIGLSNPDRFHWIGGFSGLRGLGPDWETRFAKPFREPQAVNRSVRLLWFAAGDQETRVRARNEEFSRMLDQHGIRHTFRAVTGWTHQPGLWRQNLYDFVQLLFGS